VFWPGHRPYCQPAALRASSRRPARTLIVGHAKPEVCARVLTQRLVSHPLRDDFETRSVLGQQLDGAQPEPVCLCRQTPKFSSAGRRGSHAGPIHMLIRTVRTDKYSALVISFAFFRRRAAETTEPNASIKARPDSAWLVGKKACHYATDCT
jgi:hypothetical protein